MKRFFKRILGELVDGAVRAPLTLLRIPGRTWLWLGIYLISCAALLGTVIVLLHHFWPDLRDWLIGYILPDDWHFAANLVIDRFFSRQHQIVLASAMVATSLALVTLFLFPLKELVSKSYEERARLLDKPVDEFSLWFQAWEEVKLFLFFVAVQLSIFWIGYHPGGFRTAMAIVLGYLFLIFSFGMDFISPVFQRHKGRYSRIVETLACRPVATFSFGLVFVLPAIAAGWIWRANPDWSLGTVVTVLFTAVVITMAWAAVAGTWLGARMFPSFEKRKHSSLPVRLAGWALLIGVLAWNGYVLGSLGLAVHHKSQVLKCQYSIFPHSFAFDKSKSVLASLVRKRVVVGGHFDVLITNPTPFRVELEDNRVEISHQGSVVATTRISPVSIQPGQKIDQRVDFSLDADPRVMKKGTELFHGKEWSIVLRLEIAPGYDFPVYLWPRKKG